MKKNPKKQNTIANTEAELILRIFLIFVQSEPEYSYKLYSYKKSVYIRTGLMIYWSLTWKVIRQPYWIWTDFMIYWTWTWKTLGLNYWTQIDFVRTKQGCWLEKFENLLELSIKQLVIEPSLASSISLGRTMFGVWKTKCYCCKVRYFPYPTRVIQV